MDNRLKKYKWKNRILLLETPSYNDNNYSEAKNKYENNLYEFQKRYVKLLTTLKNNFDIKLIGFDGKIKKKYNKIEIKQIFKDIDNMPMTKSKINPKSLSLYENYNKKTTIKGLGFKNKKKALHTIDKIKNEPKNYQIRVITSMMERAKYHPSKTNDMNEAINVFRKWKNEYKNEIIIPKNKKKQN